MANLFFVRTPIELFVAQQIIRQERLTENVLLYGYIGNAVHFLDIYNLMRIDELWSAKVEMIQIASWSVISRKHLLRDCIKTYKNYNFIVSTINKYSVNTLYLGDVKNHSCQLAAMSFHKKGYKICFFEEGAGHYIMNGDYGIGGNLLDKIYAVVIDLCYYLPLYNCNYGYVKFWKGFTLNDLPMDIRYSIVPYYHESFDRQLTIEPMITDKMKAFIDEETQYINTSNSVLLLSSPFYCDGINDNPNPYIKTIVDYAKSLDNKTVLHIKFHPRDFDTVKQAVISKFAVLKIRFVVLGEKLNIPVEYYLQYLRYDKIVVFLCSTEIYNGYLFPKTVFESIMEDYYINCKNAGLKEIDGIKSLIVRRFSLCS